MKRQSFFKGVIVAAVLALVGSIAFYGLSYAAGSERAFHIVAIILGGAYIAYLLRGSSERTGRIVVFSVWVAITSGVWFLTTDLTLALNKARQESITAELLDIVGGMAAVER